RGSQPARLRDLGDRQLVAPGRARADAGARLPLAPLRDDADARLPGPGRDLAALRRGAWCARRVRRREHVARGSDPDRPLRGDRGELLVGGVSPQLTQARYMNTARTSIDTPASAISSRCLTRRRSRRGLT